MTQSDAQAGLKLLGLEWSSWVARATDVLPCPASFVFVFWEYFGIFYIDDHMVSNSFISYFLVYRLGNINMLCVSVSYLFALAMGLNTALKWVKNKQSFLVPNFWTKYSVWIMKFGSYRSFVDVLYQVISNLDSIYHEQKLVLSDAFWFAFL